MPMSPEEVKALLKGRGWKLTDLAARWDMSLPWLSNQVNRADRPLYYDDAFRGLPRREDTVVIRQARHDRRLDESEKEARRHKRAADRARRKERERIWTKAEMYPRGRIFEAIDSRILEEGVRLVCLGLRIPPREDVPLHVAFQVLSGDAQGDHIEVLESEAAVRLQDIGLDFGQHPPPVDVQR